MTTYLCQPSNNLWKLSFVIVRGQRDFVFAFFLQDRLPIAAICQESRRTKSRFLIEDSEDGTHHSLTIVSVEPADGGEYGVIIDDAYTSVTRIVVTESEVFTQSIFEEPEVDASLQRSPVYDDASSDMLQHMKTSIDKGQLDEEIEEIQYFVEDDSWQAVNLNNKKISATELATSACNRMEDEYEAIKEDRLSDFEMVSDEGDDAALEVAATVAMNMTEKLLADALIDVVQLDEKDEIRSFERFPDIGTEISSSEQPIITQGEISPTQKFSFMDDSNEEPIEMGITETVTNLDSTRKEISNENIVIAETATEIVCVKKEEIEEEKIYIAFDKHEQKCEALHEFIIEETKVSHDIVVQRKKSAQVEEEYELAQVTQQEIVKAQEEEIVVQLQLDHETVHRYVEKSLPQARRCKLTVYLTFDTQYDLLPIQEIHIHARFGKAPQSETTEVILSQIIYDSDEASTMDDTFTSMSNSILYTPPEFVSTPNKTIEIKQNSRALLKAVVKGVPLPQVVWYHNNDVLASVKNSVNIIYEDGISFLEIFNCSERWNGVISCEAKNSAGVCVTQSKIKVIPQEQEERPVKIHLSNIPCQEDVEFVVYSTASTKFQLTASIPEINENIQMKCLFTGQPLPAVTWEKDGNLVDMNRNYNIISEDGITILRVECTTLDDNAVFSCTVANSFGMATAHCKVIVDEDVLIHKHIGIQVICDRKTATSEVDVILRSPRNCNVDITLRAPHVTTDSRSTSIDRDELYFTLPLEDKTFNGDTCTLKCVVMGSPIRIDWTVDNELVTEDKQVFK
ncbi:immunoglobulin I-set domain protein [Dictyocaulus viviparus]|uniref:Immunoglobulin I-set domain protein n=1 Tax=Dictyocaulus viviparus TaxID=29172 RepID=A0A0D8XAZ2_DICVI|nr:immunoglobulin I-set domain protein [Dictyocaulus viviparus]